MPSPLFFSQASGHFPTSPKNASAALVQVLADKARAVFEDVRFVAEIFPTDWQAAPDRLKQLFCAHQPSLMLHFGVAREAQSFRIETQGLNTCHMTKDSAGAMPAGLHLLTDGAPAHPVTIPTRDIVESLTRLGIAASTSGDAGGYLCNAVLYHSLVLANSAEHPCNVGFIHIPVDLSGPHLDEAAVLKGGLEIIRVCLDMLALEHG